MEASKPTGTNLAIFNEIRELTNHVEFLSASKLFCEQNVGIFEADDENKLEYTNVFESYIKILEDIIEVKLLDKFERADLDTFYADLQVNFKQYESVDSDTVSTLLGFTDFQKFKAHMLDIKI